MFSVNLSEIFQHSSSEKITQVLGVPNKKKLKKKEKPWKKEIPKVSDLIESTPTNQIRPVKETNTASLISSRKSMVNPVFADEDFVLTKSCTEMVQSSSESDHISKSMKKDINQDLLEQKAKKSRAAVLKTMANLENDYFTSKSRINIDLMSKRKGIKREAYNLINKQITILLSQTIRKPITIEFEAYQNQDPGQLIKELVSHLKSNGNLERQLQMTREENRALIKEKTHLQLELDKLQRVQEVTQISLSLFKKKGESLEEKLFEAKGELIGCESMKSEREIRMDFLNKVESLEKDLENERKCSKELKNDKRDLEETVKKLKMRVEKLEGCVKMAQNLIGPHSFKKMMANQEENLIIKLKKKIEEDLALVEPIPTTEDKKSQNGSIEDKEDGQKNKVNESLGLIVCDKFMKVGSDAKIASIFYRFLDSASILKVQNLSKTTKALFRSEFFPDFIIESRLKVQIDELATKYKRLESAVKMENIFEASDESMQELLSKYLGAKVPYKVGGQLVQSLKEFNDAFCEGIKVKNAKKPVVQIREPPQENGGAFMVFQNLFTKTHEVINNSAGSLNLTKSQNQMKEGVKVLESNSRSYFLVEQNEKQSKALDDIVGYMKNQKISQALDNTVVWSSFKSFKKSIFSKTHPDLPQKLEVPVSLLVNLVDACEFTLIEVVELSELSTMLVDEYQKAVMGVYETDTQLEQKVNELIRVHFNMEFLKKKCSEYEAENAKLRKVHGEREGKLGPLELELKLVKGILKSSEEKLEETISKLKIMIKEYMRLEMEFKKTKEIKEKQTKEIEKVKKIMLACRVD